MANEKRLIDANAEIRKLKGTLAKMKTSERSLAAEIIIAGLERADTVDAVEVVRCKDCKHSRSFKSRYVGDLTCMRWWADTKPEDFCSYGRRRADD